MYPETDVVPLRVDISKIETSELISDKAARYEKIGINKDLAKVLAKSEKAAMFETFANKFKNIKPAFIAETLISTVREIRRKFDTNIDHIGEKEFEEIFKALNDNVITKAVVMDILIDHAQDKFTDFEKYKVEEVENLEQEIKKIVDEKPGLNQGAYMGLIMKKFQGKVDGKAAMDILKKLIK